MMVHMRAGGAFMAAALLILTVACADVEDHPTLVVDATADVLGVLFLDANGNGALDQQDEPVEGWRVTLIAANGVPLADTVSDTLGIFRMLDVPAGQARLELDRSRLGDTLEVFGIALDETFTLGRGDSVVVSIGFTYPAVDLGAVDTVVTGRRVFTEGIALNSLFSNGPRELHLRSGGEALRITSVVRRQVSAGDSVRVLGRRAVEKGAAILTEAEIFPLTPAVEDPQPLLLGTGPAATADGGAHPAQLVRIRDADLLSSTNLGNDVILTVDDGSGPLEILVPAFLGSDASSFEPDLVRVRQATGLLVPYFDEEGETLWRLALRDAADLRLEPEEPDEQP